MRGGEIKYYGETSSLDNRTVDKEKWVFFGGGEGAVCLFVFYKNILLKKKEKGTKKISFCCNHNALTDLGHDNQ